MDERDVRIGALPDTDEVIELVGFGRVRRGPGAASEMQVEVLFAPVGRDGRFAADAAVGRAWMGCGQLPLAATGSRWRRRVRIDPPRVRARRAEAVAVGMETIGRRAVGLGVANYPFDGVPGIPCYRLRLDGDPVKIALVPVVEVLRAVFGVTSGFLRQLFDGCRDPCMAGGRFLFDRSSSTVSDGVVTLRCHSEPTKLEAFIAASIMASDSFRTAHDGVFSGLQGSEGFRKDPMPFVMTTFPFDRPVGFQYESRIIGIEQDSQQRIHKDGARETLRRAATKRELITRILSYDAEIPFHAVVYEWPGTTAREDLPPAAGRTRSGFMNTLLVHSGAAPGTSRVSVNVAAQAAAAERKDGVEYIPCVAILGERALTSTLVDDPVAEGQGSTADARPDGDDSVARVEIESADPRKLPGERLRSMILTDLAVRTLVGKRGWSAQGLADTPGGAPPLCVVGKSAASFQIAVFAIDMGRDEVLLVEAGSCSRRRRALGVVVRSGPGAVDRKAVDRFVFEQRASWFGRKLPGHAIGRVVRPEGVWHQPERYADLIGEAIDRIVRRRLDGPSA